MSNIEADFDIEHQLYLEEMALAATDPNYCSTCLNRRVLYDGRGGSEPCPECSKECACGATVEELTTIYGSDYQGEHISECPYCHQQTLHVADEWQKCLYCKHGSEVDAEGNHYTTDEAGSHMVGESIETRRLQYFASNGVL